MDDEEGTGFFFGGVVIASYPYTNNWTQEVVGNDNKG